VDGIEVHAQHIKPGRNHSTANAGPLVNVTTTATEKKQACKGEALQKTLYHILGALAERGRRGWFWFNRRY